jgi:hypothetical protein
MTDAITGVNSLLRYYNIGLSAWASLGEVKDVNGPSMSRETHDVTSFASVNGYREFIPGLRDPGTLTFSMFFNRADYDAMKALFESDVEQDFELILNDDDNTSLEMSGYVTEMPLTVPEGPVECNVTIKISGQITINSGTASTAF